MTEPVFTVDPNASLAKTAREMAAHRYGSAVVLDHGIVVGLFTTTDALRALAAVLESASQEAA